MRYHSAPFHELPRNVVYTRESGLFRYHWVHRAWEASSDAGCTGWYLIGLLYVLGAWAIVHLSTLKFWWDLAKLNSPKVLESW